MAVKNVVYKRESGSISYYYGLYNWCCLWLLLNVMPHYVPTYNSIYTLINSGGSRWHWTIDTYCRTTDPARFIFSESFTHAFNYSFVHRPIFCVEERDNLACYKLWYINSIRHFYVASSRKRHKVTVLYFGWETTQGILYHLEVISMLTKTYKIGTLVQSVTTIRTGHQMRKVLISRKRNIETR